MILHSSDSLLVELQRLIRCGGQIQVKPDHSAVVGADNQMVSTGVHVNAGQPLAATHQLLDQLLLYQVEHLDMLLRCHKQERSGRMEGHCLDVTRRLSEGVLRPALG